MPAVVKGMKAGEYDIHRIRSRNGPWHETTRLLYGMRTRGSRPTLKEKDNPFRHDSVAAGGRVSAAAV